MIDPQVVCLHSQGWIESSGKFTRTLQYYRLSNSTLPWVCRDNLWTSSKTSHLPLSGSRPDSQYINLASPPPSLLYLDKFSLVIGPALLTSFVEIFLVLFLTAEVGEILLGSPGPSDHLEPGAFARVTSARWLYLWSDTVKFFIIPDLNFILVWIIFKRSTRAVEEQGPTLNIGTFICCGSEWSVINHHLHCDVSGVVSTVVNHEVVAAVHWNIVIRPRI